MAWCPVMIFSAVWLISGPPLLGIWYNFCPGQSIQLGVTHLCFLTFLSFVVSAFPSSILHSVLSGCSPAIVLILVTMLSLMVFSKCQLSFFSPQMISLQLLTQFIFMLKIPPNTFQCNFPSSPLIVILVLFPAMNIPPLSIWTCAATWNEMQ